MNNVTKESRTVLPFWQVYLCQKTVEVANKKRLVLEKNELGIS
jgi:hypothetical protein